MGSCAGTAMSTQWIEEITETTVVRQYRADWSIHAASEWFTRNPACRFVLINGNPPKAPSPSIKTYCMMWRARDDTTVHINTIGVTGPTIQAKRKSSHSRIQVVEDEPGHSRLVRVSMNGQNVRNSYDVHSTYSTSVGSVQSTGIQSDSLADCVRRVLLSP